MAHAHQQSGTCRSIYGKDFVSPNAKVAIWKHAIATERKIRNSHLAFRNQPKGFPTEAEPPNANIYGPRTCPTLADIEAATRLYDRLFHQPRGYDGKLHRDDRKSVLELGKSVNQEELCRGLPVLSSSIYGRRVCAPLEPHGRAHVHVNHLLNSAKVIKGTGLPPINL